MSWNYRVLALEHNNEIYFQIREVYYDKEGIPHSYSTSPSYIESENISEMEWTLSAYKEALSKPILYSGKKFPNEYKDNSNNKQL